MFVFDMNTMICNSASYHLTYINASHHCITAYNSNWPLLPSPNDARRHGDPPCHTLYNPSHSKTAPPARQRWSLIANLPSTQHQHELPITIPAGCHIHHKPCQYSSSIFCFSWCLPQASCRSSMCSLLLLFPYLLSIHVLCRD